MVRKYLQQRNLPKRTLFFCCVVLAMFVSTVSVTWAANFINNGSFASDLSGWTLNSQDGYQAPQATWESGGYSGTINNAGNSYNGVGGAVRLYSGQGSGLERKGYLWQTFTVNQSSPTVKLSFTWKKNWTVKKPAKQDLRVYLVKPGGAVVELWNHTAVANTSDSNWYKVEDLDLSSHFSTNGTYEIRLHTWLKTGSDASAAADAWYDEIYLDLPVQDTAPATPSGLTVDNAGSGTALWLSWQANGEGDLAGYNLYRSTDNANFSKINGSLITGNTYSDIGLTEGQTYFYRITAQDTGGLESPPSSSVSGIPSDTPPATPAGLTVSNTGTGGKLNITWDANREIDLAGYNLYRSTNNLNFSKINGSLILDSAYADTELTDGQTYYYKVAAVDSGNQESALSSSQAGTPSSIPAGQGLLLNSSMANNLDGWLMSGSIKPKNLTPILPPDYVFESSGYSGSLVNGSTSYNGVGGAARLQVSGSSAEGWGHLFQRLLFKPAGDAYLSFAWKKSYSGTTPSRQTARVILIKPNGVPVKLWENTVISNSDTWQKVENLNLSGYMLGYGGYQLEFWADLKNAADSSAVTRVFFDEMIFTVGKSPSTSTGLRAIPVTSGGEIELWWNANPEGDIRGYKVWRSTDNNTYTLLTSDSVPTTQYLDSGLTNGQEYYYKINAVDTSNRESPVTRPVKVYPRVADLGSNAHTSYLTYTNACQLCHRSHKGEAPMLLNETSETGVCITCHDGTGSIFNLATDYAVPKVSYHPVKNTQLAPAGKLVCSSCHDPHDATGLRTTPVAATGSIQGSFGVEVNYGSTPFVQPATTLKGSINQEYEQCLRCHSGHDAGNEQSSLREAGKEFNPNNLSYHGSLGNTTGTGFGNYTGGWQADMPVFCGDCHGSNNSLSVAGPHSSNFNNILKQSYSANTSSPDSTLCFSCHPATSHANGGASDTGTLFRSRDTKDFAVFDKNLHNSPGGHKSGGCAVCHAAVPHGINWRALLATTSDPPRYAQYVKNITIDYPNDGNWQYDSCLTANGCH